MADNKNETLIQDAVALGAAPGSSVANLTKGGQVGIGLNPDTLNASTPVIFSPVVFIIMQVPEMYKDIPEMGTMIKSLIETHAKEISGIDFGYSLETTGQPIGNDGQSQEVPTKSKRSQVTPTFVFAEVTGNLVWNVFLKWMSDIQPADSNAAMSEIENPGPYTMNTYSATGLAIQFDPTMLPENIIDGAMYINMYPTDPGGTLGLEKTVSAAKNPERTVVMTAVVIHNETVRLMCRRIAKDMQLHKVNFNKAKAYISDINSALSDVGIKQEAASAIAAEGAESTTA